MMHPGGMTTRHGAAAVHEGVVGVASRDRRKAGVREDMGGVQESAAEAVAYEVLRVQRVLAGRLARFLLRVQGIGYTIGSLRQCVPINVLIAMYWRIQWRMTA